MTERNHLLFGVNGEGDDAYAELLDQVYRDLTGRGATHEEAQNGAQHAVIQWWRLGKERRRIENGRAWRAAVGWRHVVADRRHRKRQHDLEEIAAGARQTQEFNPWNEVEKRDECARLQRGIDELPPVFRGTVRRIMGGQTVTQIAKAYGVSPQTIRNWFATACRLLRAMLERGGKG